MVTGVTAVAPVSHSAKEIPTHRGWTPWASTLGSNSRFSCVARKVKGLIL